MWWMPATFILHLLLTAALLPPRGTFVGWSHPRSIGTRPRRVRGPGFGGLAARREARLPPARHVPASSGPEYRIAPHGRQPSQAIASHRPCHRVGLWHAPKRGPPRPQLRANPLRGQRRGPGQPNRALETAAPPRPGGWPRRSARPPPAGTLGREGPSRRGAGVQLRPPPPARVAGHRQATWRAKAGRPPGSSGCARQLPPPPAGSVRAARPPLMAPAPRAASSRGAAPPTTGTPRGRLPWRAPSLVGQDRWPVRTGPEFWRPT